MSDPLDRDRRQLAELIGALSTNDRDLDAASVDELVRAAITALRELQLRLERERERYAATEVRLHTAMEQARDAETRTRTILDTVTHGILAIRANGLITSFNPAAERIFGYRADEVLGRNVSMLMDEPHHSAHDGYLDRYDRTGDARIIGIGREVEGRRKDGSQVALELAVGQMEIQGERYYTGILSDITHRRAVDRLKDEFVSTVSHELRTPLTSIGGALRLIEGGAVGPVSDGVTDLVALATSNCDRLMRLINDILDLEKLQAGHIELVRVAQDLRAVVGRGVGELRAFADEARVTVRIAPGDAVTSEVDADRIVQVVVNLVSNAVKFSAASSTVQVSVRQMPTGSARVEVVDTGSGIRAEDLPRLFHRFQQLDASDRRQKGGTGLGLAISKSLVEAHGGTLGVSSAMGEGSTFWFELPRTS